MAASVVFLLDVDNTLLDDDRIISDLHEHFENELGVDSAQRYWAIFDGLRDELGYVDYLGALQDYRLGIKQGSADEQRLLRMSSYLIDYPFSDRLYPCALKVIEHLNRFGQTVILTDGDMVLQPRKVQRSGLWDAVDGRVLIYVHKEQMLDAVQRHYPARHYVMVDDKLRVLAAMKSIWRERLTTVFPRQGHYALDPVVVATQPVADFTIEHIGELADLDLLPLIKQRVDVTRANEET